jgi:hypothetical protein
VIRFGQAKTADPLAGGELRQVFGLLRIRAEFVDGHHHQRRLHRHHRAVAGIDALHFTRDQPVAHVVEARAAVFLGNGRSQQPEFAHFTEDFDVGLLMPERFQHARLQPVLRIGCGGFAHHAFFFGELLIEQQRVFPVKLRGVGHDAYLLNRILSDLKRLT